MQLPPTSEASCREAVELFQQHNRSWTQAAKASGIPRGTLRSRYKIAIKRGYDPKIKSPAPEGHTIKGVSTYYDKDGLPRAQWVKTRNEPTLEDMVEAIKDGLLGLEGLSRFIPAPIEELDENLVNVFPLVDLHLGMYADEKETGTEHTLDKAVKLILGAETRVIRESPKAKTAVIMGLGDMLHADNSENRTLRSGNVLDVDGRYGTILYTAVQLVAAVIEVALEKHEKVIVRLLPGNHDDHSALAISLAVHAWFRNNERVEVDLDTSRFWWWRFGKVFLGATHGDRAKIPDLPLLMAARNPLDWGKSKFRQIFTGHIHKQTEHEITGVLVRSFRTPIPPDSFHHAFGYLAGRSVLVLTFHRETGPHSTHYVNIT